VPIQTKLEYLVFVDLTLPIRKFYPLISSSLLSQRTTVGEAPLIPHSDLQDQPWNFLPLFRNHSSNLQRIRFSFWFLNFIISKVLFDLLVQSPSALNRFKIYLVHCLLRCSRTHGCNVSKFYWLNRSDS
jgi:hypothetical protein